MNIILSNYRYFISGGPEKYYFSVKKLLEKRGHSVVPFSVHSNRNEATPWSKYFISPVGDRDSVYFDEYKLGLSTAWKVVERSIYSPEAYFASRRLARDARPDLVYSLHFLNKMSPSIIDGFRSRNVPIIIRVSDFALICPQALFLRNSRVCTECLTNGVWRAVRHKCVKNSRLGSGVKVMAHYIHRMLGVYKGISAIVCPSRFTMEKYLEAGFDPARLRHVPTFIDASSIDPDYEAGDYILFFGRLTEEKGVQYLIEAYRGLDRPKPYLLIIGASPGAPASSAWDGPLPEGIKILPFMSQQELSTYIRRSMFVVMPSICYENMPNTVLEAFAHGKPVIASDLGSLKELVVNGETGYLFQAGDSADLRRKMETVLGSPDHGAGMGKKARRYVENNHSPESHLDTLLALFTEFAGGC